MNIESVFNITLNDDPSILLPKIITKSGLLKRGDARDIYIYMWESYYLHAKKEAAKVFSKKTKGRSLSQDMKNSIRKECFAIKDKDSCVEISSKDLEEETGILQPNIARAIKKLEAEGFITCLKKGNRWNPAATYQINIGIFEMMGMIGIENLIGWDRLKPYWKKEQEAAGRGEGEEAPQKAPKQAAQQAKKAEVVQFPSTKDKSVRIERSSQPESVTTSPVKANKKETSKVIDISSFMVDEDDTQDVWYTPSENDYSGSGGYDPYGYDEDEYNPFEDEYTNDSAIPY
ncbi:MarR family transcriptional regulator [Escherichia coli]|nr:MarR family transcriptional regulator [Escherichia coli]EEW9035001.1 MarR family transcriptional regulator [Escherichia coli]HDH8863917.1 MarR family transcriptional regulator [Escherichia coli]